MSTTTGITDTIPCAFPTKPSTWQLFKRSLSEALSSFVCGCYSAEELAEFEADVAFRTSVRQHMIMQEESLEVATKPLACAMVESVIKDDYVLGDMDIIRKANEGVSRSEKDWDRYFQKLGVDPKTQRTTGMKGGRLIPRFATACVFALRAKPGVGRKRTEDNILVATRAYQDMCKKHGVHTGDRDRHLQMVLNGFFTEDITSRIGTSRQRAPRWLKWLYDIDSYGTTQPTIC